MCLSPALFFLCPNIHAIFVCTKCWCLSYVFSAFGLFSYCLPGLFGSGASQPVRCFLALLERHAVSLTVCFFAISVHHWPPCLSLLSVCFPYCSSPSIHSLPLRFYFATFSLFVCVSFKIHLYTSSFCIFSWSFVWFFYTIVLFLCFPVIWLRIYLCFVHHFVLSYFYISFELHFQSVCMCMVVCRLQWRTSWRRRCQRKEDAGGSHGGAGIATPNQ